MDSVAVDENTLAGFGDGVAVDGEATMGCQVLGYGFGCGGGIGFGYANSSPTPNRGCRLPDEVPVPESRLRPELPVIEPDGVPDNTMMVWQGQRRCARPLRFSAARHQPYDSILDNIFTVITSMVATAKEAGSLPPWRYEVSYQDQRR